MKLEYILVPSSRISAGKTGQVQNSRDIHHVIPGSVIRGALGSAWWQPTPHGSKADFDRLFAREMEVRAAVPLNPDLAAPEELQTHFEPLSWVKCKYPVKGPAGCPTAWHDQAVALMSARSGNAASADWLQTCPTCRHPVQPSKSGWDIPASWSVATTRTSLTGGVATDDELYTRKAVSKHVIYRGTLWLRQDPSGEALAWLTEEKHVRVGGQLSTMGRALWRAVVVEDPPVPEATAYEVRLRAPALLVDAYGAPSLDLAAAVEHSLRLAGAPGHVLHTWTRPETVSGWHGMSGLPKPQEWAVATGSVALVTQATSATATALAGGIGMRRLEGYGEVDLFPLDANAPLEVTRIRVGVESPSLAEPVTRRGETATETAILAADTELPIAAPQPPVSDRTAPDSGASPEPVAAVPAEQPVTAAPPAFAGQATTSGALVAELIAALPEPVRVKTLRATLDEARNVQRLRSTLAPDLIARRIRDVVTKPWMRDLTGRPSGLVQEILASDDLADLVIELSAAVGGGH